MVQSGVCQCAERLFRDADRRRNKIGVKTGRMGTGGDVHEIAPGTRLVARQMHLQRPKRGRFAEDSEPSRGIEFLLSPIEREWVRAIGAAERTTMGELGEEPERLMERCGTNAAA
jgi:hypothetical protein